MRGVFAALCEKVFGSERRTMARETDEQHSELADVRTEVSERREARLAAEADLKHFRAAELRDLGETDKARQLEREAAEIAKRRLIEAKKAEALRTAEKREGDMTYGLFGREMDEG